MTQSKPMKKNTLLLLLFPVLLHAQTANTAYERDYKRAIGLFKMGDYVLAINDLGVLTGRKYNNSITPYAHYYYALASQRIGRFAEAKQMLQQLRERFPDWTKMEDVNYLMADLAFQEKQFGEGLDYLLNLTNPQIKRDADALKKYRFLAIKDLAYLKNLYQQYPNDRILGIALIDLIQQSATNKADLELSDQLTNRFGVTPISKPASTTITPIASGGAFQKGYYNVSVLLPFKLDDFEEGQRARANQFAYDMYEGMKLAKTKLQQEGILVNLFAYDLANQPNDMTDLTNNSNFAQSDFVVGPLYIEPAKIAADFAEANKVYLLQPTAVTAELITNRTHTFLLQPTLERQTSQLFDFAQSLQPTAKKIAIYYGASRRDSTTAAWYRTKATAAGMQVLDFRKTREKLDSTASIGDYNKPAHVALFSSNDNDGLKVVNMLNKRRINTPLMATATAFDLARVSGAAFSGRPIYLINNEYIDISKPQVRDFQAQYMTKRNTVPSVYAMQGYDIVLFFGRMIHKHKTQLRAGLDTSNYSSDDYLLSGFNYQKSNDNQVVPILKIEDLRLVQVR